jgi:hypothetical protein
MVVAAATHPRPTHGMDYAAKGLLCCQRAQSVEPCAAGIGSYARPSTCRRRAGAGAVRASLELVGAFVGAGGGRWGDSCRAWW